MEILPLSFRTSQLCGVWYEDFETYRIPKMIYRVLGMTLVLYTTATELIDLVTSRGDVEGYTERLFITMTSFGFSLKLLNFVFRRKKMLELLGKFRAKICQPRSEFESAIVQKHLRFTAILHKIFTFLALATGIVQSLVPLLNWGVGKIELPYSSYQPYDMSNDWNFASAYVIQVMYTIYGITLNICFDVMGSGFMRLTSGQFEICYHRFIKAVSEGHSESDIHDCIDHHLCIQDIARCIQSFYIGVVAPFFFTTLLTLCASIFQMSKTEFLSLKFLSLVMYLNTLLNESFWYCWTGNSVKLKSQSINDAIYNSDWTSMNPRIRKKLLFSMLIANKGSTISLHGQCSLCVDTFVWIIKTAYGAFNLLQQVSKK